MLLLLLLLVVVVVVVVVERWILACLRHQRFATVAKKSTMPWHRCSHG